MMNLTVADLDTAPCGFLSFSESGKIETINQTLVDLLEYQHRDELVGTSLEQLFNIAGRIFYQTHFYPLLNLHGEANEIFFLLKTKKNNKLPVICNALRKEINGRYSHHCIFIPATERGKYEAEILNAKRVAEVAVQQNAGLTEAKKELELNSIELDRQVSRLKQVNQDITQFSKIISHDLQEPIRKIAVLADRLATRASQLFTPSQINELEKINKECRRLRALAANLERFISLNIKTEEFANLDLHEVVQKAFSEARSRFPGIPVGYTTELLPRIDGYEQQLSLLFYNLFENCLKFRDPLKELTIAVDFVIIQQNSFRTIQGKYRYIDFLKITVTDNGVGFENPNNEEVTALQQLSIDRYIGFGFGLAFCKKIADNHYGSIHAQSVKGKGTTIIILLPREQTAG